MSIYDKFIDEEFYQNCFYYRNISNIGIPIKDLNNISCYDFIRNYFRAGKKEYVFSIDFIDDLKRNGKHIHTVVLYFLGCYLSRIVRDKVIYSNSNNAHEKCFDFRYTWFLSCLYHDTAFAIESESDLSMVDHRAKDLDFYLGKYGIKYNVYNHSPIKPGVDLYTFPLDVVKNYFYYRVDYSKKIDHGIIGGFLLYDRLIKNYNNIFKIKSKINNQCDYNHFQYNGLDWRIEQQENFAMVADSIIAHNIWFGDEKDIYYIKYGLDTLIKEKSNKIKLTDRPLVFFLSLLDTIEPTKRFYDKGPKEVLESLDISYQPIERLIVIKALYKDINYKDYFEHIKTLGDWLDVQVIEEHEDEICIKINN